MTLRRKVDDTILLEPPKHLPTPEACNSCLNKMTEIGGGIAAIAIDKESLQDY